MIKIDRSLQFDNNNQENIKQEIEFLDSFIDYQKNLKGYISNNFDNLSLNTNLKTEQTDEVTNLFQKVFEARLNIDCNIINLQKLSNSLKKFRKEKGFLLIAKITLYNESFKKKFPDIKTKTDFAKKVSLDLYDFLETKQKKSKKESISSIPEFDLETIPDNKTLRISEKTGKVYLPYLVEDLKKILEENPDKYSCLKDLINKKYIIPLNYYKNSSYARFKEAYKLIREKEKGSIQQALNLSFELLFNYNLDPAIISACKNQDELDIYLDCLEDNEIEDFYCFDIVYEVMPLIVSENKSKKKEKIA